MRLLFITEFFAPHAGGSEFYALELLSRLKSDHPDALIDVLCYNTNSAADFEKMGGLRVYRIPAFPLLKDQFYLPNPLPLMRALLKLSRNHYDFVLSQVRFFDPCWWAWVYARAIGAKSIFIEHGTGFAEHPSLLVRLLARWVDKTIASFSLKRYNRVVVISQATQEFVERDLGVKGTFLIYGGVNTEEFPLKGRKTREKLKIVFLGRLIWAKGPQVLLDGFSSFLKTTEADAELVFGGSGPLKESLVRQTRGLGLADRVIFLGPLDRKGVKTLLLETDVFVNPSFNEGLARVLMEAGSAGAFVVATDVGATGEIVADNKDGKLVRPGNAEDLAAALRWFLANQNKARRMGKALSAKVKDKFDWKVISQKFWQLLIRA